VLLLLLLLSLLEYAVTLQATRYNKEAQKQTGFFSTVPVLRNGAQNSYNLQYTIHAFIYTRRRTKYRETRMLNVDICSIMVFINSHGRRNKGNANIPILL